MQDLYTLGNLRSDIVAQGEVGELVAVQRVGASFFRLGLAAGLVWSIWEFRMPKRRELGVGGAAAGPGDAEEAVHRSGRAAAGDHDVERHEPGVGEVRRPGGRDAGDSF